MRIAMLETGSRPFLLAISLFLRFSDFSRLLRVRLRLRLFDFVLSLDTRTAPTAYHVQRITPRPGPGSEPAGSAHCQDNSRQGTFATRIR